MDPASSAVFGRMTPFGQLGMTPRSGPTPANNVPGIARVAGPGLHDASPLWHPDNPMFWIGVAVLATVGLIGSTVRVKAGPIRAGASIGKSGETP